MVGDLVITISIPHLMQVALYLLLSGSLSVALYFCLTYSKTVTAFVSRIIRNYLAMCMILILGMFAFLFHGLFEILERLGCEFDDTNPY